MLLKAKATIAVQNETEDFDVKAGVPHLLGLQTGTDNHAAADFELWVSYNDGVTWTLCDIYDVADPAGATLAKLTGASKAGFAYCPGATAVRAKRTDANAGDATLQINVPEA